LYRPLNSRVSVGHTRHFLFALITRTSDPSDSLMSACEHVSRVRHARSWAARPADLAKLAD